jgi:hypothetical protein
VGVVVAIVGLGASVLRAGGPSSGIGMVLGAWLILLSVMPTAARSIGVTIAVMIGLRTAAALASAIPLLRPCSPLNTAVNCDAFRAVSAAILAIHGAANCYSVYVGVLLLTYRFAMTGRIACLRLTGWPPRAALDALWRAIGVEMVLVGLGWLVLGGLEQLEPRLNGSYGPETNLAPTTRAAIRFALGLELVVLGGLALWPRLRTAVQFKFASIGEGVAAAAGIAAWLGADGHSDAQIFSRAVDTFRSVRCDQLQPHHLDTNEPAAEAYALWSGAQLGSVDVRAARAAHAPARAACRMEVRSASPVRPSPRAVLRPVATLATAISPSLAEHPFAVRPIARLPRLPCARSGLPLALVARRPVREMAAAAGVARALRQGAQA